MPRSIWNGTIAFGNVRVPVKLHTAVEPGGLSLREVHAGDAAPIRHLRFCTEEDREVPYSEVVKGYEVGDGEYVVLDREEIAAAARDRGRIIEIEEFVEAAEIDPVFHERTYHLGAGDDGRAYAVLREAMRRTGRAGIGRFSFRNREYLASIRARGAVIELHTLRFHDEVIDPSEIEVRSPGREPGERELKLAHRLIDSLREEFDPGAYADTYTAALMETIEAKAAGEKPPEKPRRSREESGDLSSALESSLG